MLTKKTVTLTSVIEMTYDPESPEFKEALKGYGETYNDKDPEEDDLLEHIAYNLNRTRDVCRMIEGVGYVKCRGHIEDTELYCGVEVDEDDPTPEIQVD